MASNAVTTQQPRTLGEAVNAFQDQIVARADEFRSVLPAHITPEKFQRTVMTAIQGDPELLRADRRSLILACQKAAQDGLLPDKREAALVVFKTNQKDAQGQWHEHKLVQYMPMVYGLRKKILQSGEIKALTTSVVYRAEVESGSFIYELGSEAMLRHRPMLELTVEQTSDSEIVAAYSVATLNDGTTTFEVMRRAEIDAVREKSQTGATKDRKGKPRQPSGPWVDWFGEMARKTVMRRHSKMLPMSGDIIDDEAMAEAVAARSAMTVLGSTSADAPSLSAPRRDEEAFDAQTGEVLALDPNITPESPNAEEGRADADMGEAHYDEQTRQERHPAEAVAEKIIGRIKLRESPFAIDNILRECQEDIDAMPEEIAGEVHRQARFRKEQIEREEARAAELRG